MKKENIVRILVLVLLLGNFISCKKEPVELNMENLIIDPTSQPEKLSQVLQMSGSYYKGNFPKKDTINYTGLKISFPQTSVSISPGVPIVVPFTVNGLNQLLKLCSVYFKVKGANSYWSVALDTANTVGTDFAFTFMVPEGITNTGTFDLIATVEVCGSLGAQKYNFVTNPDTIKMENLPPVFCGDTFSGPARQLTFRKVDLGNKKGMVKVSYINTGVGGTIGDRLDIKYGNEYVVSTGTKLGPSKIPTCRNTKGGTDGFEPTNGWKQFTFEYDPAKSKVVLVYGLGNCFDSNGGWSLVVQCPE